VKLTEVFARAKAENRAALIGYMPGGFPDKEGSKKLIAAMVDGGVDIVEVGFPYSDPVMDGPVIQQAAEIALKNRTSADDVFEVVASTSVPTLVMSYWNPISRYGIRNFAEKLTAASGVGVITPDLTIEESAEWISATRDNAIDRIYVVAPSTTDNRLAKVTEACSGFVYAASLMGVTGTRTAISGTASELVNRIRKVTELPIAVGLGVSNAQQAKEVARYADGVIVGSAFIKLVLESASIEEGAMRVRTLAEQLAAGVRRR
jgi:tryptophan synthase alpha chain